MHCIFKGGGFELLRLYYVELQSITQQRNGGHVGEGCPNRTHTITTVLPVQEWLHELMTSRLRG